MISAIFAKEDEGAAAAALRKKADTLFGAARSLIFDMDGTLADSTTQEWQQVLATNVIAPATLTRALLPALGGLPGRRRRGQRAGPSCGGRGAGG